LKNSHILLLILFLYACTPAVKVIPTPVAPIEPAQIPSFVSKTTQIPSITITPQISDRGIKPEFEKYFKGYKGAFVLYDLKADKYIRYNPEQCAEEFIPASTFKILNSLTGLETGIIADENFVIKWDGIHYDNPAWNKDQTLKTAFQDSVVWYFQELARRVGKDRMYHYLVAADYGNKDISGHIDSFWLDGGLRISANEQVTFLKRMYQGEFFFSARTVNIVKNMMVLEKTESHTLSGKTGSAQRASLHTGWFVGYLETQGNVYFFATNIESSNPDGLANGETAKLINMEILKGLGYLP
jgi:beta-lactamase class D